MLVTVVSILLLLLVAAFAAWRAIEAIRDGVMGWGATRPVFVQRRKNPSAFWFFVAILTTGSVAACSLAFATLLGIANAA